MTEIRNIGGVLSSSVRLYRKAFKKVFLLSLLLGILAVIAFVLVSSKGLYNQYYRYNANPLALIMQRYHSLDAVKKQVNKNASTVRPSKSASSVKQASQIVPAVQPSKKVSVKQQIVQKTSFVRPKIGLISILFLIVFYLLMFYVGLMMIKMEGEISRGNEVNYKSVASYVSLKYFVCLAAFLVSGIMLCVAFMSLLLTIFLIPLFPFLFLYCVILFKFIVPGIMFDNKGVFSSITYSVRLVWGNWWRTFIVFLVPGMLVFFIMSIVMLLGFILQAVFQAGLSGYMTFVFTNIIMIIVMVLVLPWLVAVFLEQYQDLKLRYDRKQELLLEKLSQWQKNKV